MLLRGMSLGFVALLLVGCSIEVEAPFTTDSSCRPRVRLIRSRRNPLLTPQHLSDA